MSRWQAGLSFNKERVGNMKVNIGDTIEIATGGGEASGQGQNVDDEECPVKWARDVGRE
jgi:hypothetical protein